MNLSEQLDRVARAERLLITEQPYTEIYNAAKNTLTSLIEWSQSDAVKQAAQDALNRWIARSHAYLCIPLPRMRPPGKS